MKRQNSLLAALLSSLLIAPAAYSQQPAPASAGVTKPVDGHAAGDSPDDAGPLATGLSPALRPMAIHQAMNKVANWQVKYAEASFNQQWTFAALYDGLLASSRSTGDQTAHDAVLHMAEGFHWQLLDTRFPHADDEALGRAYLELYQEHPSPERMANTKEIMDRLVVRPDDPKKLVWWWCDALFMAPPVLARTALITHDRKYLDYMDREWWESSSYLYDPSEHLYFRDDSYFHKTEANGKKLFWSRGNGWVLAGLATILPMIPADYPSRPKYVQQFKEMAQKIASLQQPDGLWRTGLLDPEAYSASEISGSGFFTYAIAWGVNNGVLDRKVYAPVLEKAWAGMLQHVYADGRLGSIQPIGAAPGAFKPSSSYVYGVGAFLLAGSELAKLREAKGGR